MEIPQSTDSQASVETSFEACRVQVRDACVKQALKHAEHQNVANMQARQQHSSTNSSTTAQQSPDPTREVAKLHQESKHPRTHHTITRGFNVLIQARN
jgi:hypothetical protein